MPRVRLHAQSPEDHSGFADLHAEWLLGPSWFGEPDDIEDDPFDKEAYDAIKQKEAHDGQEKLV